MDLFIYVLVWSMLSIVAWIIVLDKDKFDYGKFHNLKIISFILLTLPATLIIFLLTMLVIIVGEIKERRKRNKQIEESRWGIFKRQVLIEKCCDHKWQDLNKPVNFLSRTKKFHCIKCKKKIDINLWDYDRMRECRTIVDEYGYLIQERIVWW